MASKPPEWEEILGVVKETIACELKTGSIPRIALVYSLLSPNGQLLSLDILPSADSVGPALRSMCKLVDAWGIIQVSEAWALELGPNWSKEEAREEYKKWAGKLGDHPNRVDKAIIVWEHKRTQGTSMANIVEKDGVRSLGPWEDAEKIIEGRLMGILPGARGN